MMEKPIWFLKQAIVSGRAPYACPGPTAADLLNLIGLGDKLVHLLRQTPETLRLA